MGRWTLCGYGMKDGCMVQFGQAQPRVAYFFVDTWKNTQQGKVNLSYAAL
jgi:hypothetical protein